MLNRNTANSGVEPLASWSADIFILLLVQLPIILI